MCTKLQINITVEKEFTIVLFVYGVKYSAKVKL